MWQAISRLLSEQLGEGEIELRNELPGGEVHAAWHLRYAGHDFFVKCDEGTASRFYRRSRPTGVTVA